MSITFAPDALLGLEIEELLDEEPACEATHDGTPCGKPAAWWVTCPLCAFRMAWCHGCRARYWELVHELELKGQRYGIRDQILVTCPKELGGCERSYPAEALLFEPLTRLS